MVLADAGADLSHDERAMLARLADEFMDGQQDAGVEEAAAA